MTPLWFCSALHISFDLNYVWHTRLYQDTIFIIISLLLLLYILLYLLKSELCGDLYFEDNAAQYPQICPIIFSPA